MRERGQHESQNMSTQQNHDIIRHTNETDSHFWFTRQHARPLIRSLTQDFRFGSCLYYVFAYDQMLHAVLERREHIQSDIPRCQKWNRPQRCELCLDARGIGWCSSVFLCCFDDYFYILFVLFLLDCSRNRKESSKMRRDGVWLQKAVGHSRR